jgi:hypothetical protein
MKTSIAITLIITAAIFSFVSGYSIGSHSDQAAGYGIASQATSGSNGVATATAAEKAPEQAAPTAGYGNPSGAASAGYGAPSAGYGQ